MSAEEELLAALVSGELPQDDPRAQALFQERPELREEVEALRALGGRLAGAGDYEQAAVAAQEDPGDQSREAARRAVLEAPGPAPRLTSRRRWLTLVGAAAAGIAAISLWPRDDQPADPGGEIYLGSSGDFDIRLDGELAAPDRIHWDPADLSGGASYRVLLYDSTGASRSVAEGLDKPEWSPDDPSIWSDWVKIEVRIEEPDKSLRSEARFERSF